MTTIFVFNQATWPLNMPTVSKQCLLSRSKRAYDSSNDNSADVNIDKATTLLIGDNRNDNEGGQSIYNFFSCERTLTTEKLNNAKIY